MSFQEVSLITGTKNYFQKFENSSCLPSRLIESSFTNLGQTEKKSLSIKFWITFVISDKIAQLTSMFLKVNMELQNLF